MTIIKLVVLIYKRRSQKIISWTYSIIGLSYRVDGSHSITILCEISHFENLLSISCKSWSPYLITAPVAPDVPSTTSVLNP